MAIAKIRVEACRAAVLAVHAAVGLAGGPGADQQLLRVLRASEALARTSVALALTSLSAAAAPRVRVHGPAERPRAAGDDAMPVDESAPRARKKRRSAKKRKGEIVKENDANDMSTALPTCQPPHVQLSPDAAAFVPRALVAQSSRERSPRRTAQPPSISSDAASSSVVPSISVDDIAMVVALRSRPELTNSRCRVLGFDSEANRYRIVLEDLGEITRVKPEALGKCLFPGCFRDGPTIAAAT